jgi:hypothetical protein
MAVDISKVTSLCDKIDSNVKNVGDENVKGVLSDISAALRLINGNHEGIIKYQMGNIAGATGNHVNPGLISLGNVAKKNHVSSQSSGGNIPESGAVGGNVNTGPPLLPLL